MTGGPLGTTGVRQDPSGPVGNRQHFQGNDLIKAGRCALGRDVRERVEYMHTHRRVSYGASDGM